VSYESNPLSDREMEILQLLATGATNHQIARELFISINTVKVHLRNIYTKLEVASRTEATMVAVREGWVVVPRPDDAEEVATEATADQAAIEGAPAAMTGSGLPAPERWPRVALAKRISLAVATVLALMVLLLPQVLQGSANGTEPDPIGGVFPTAPSDASASRWHTHAQMPTPRTGLAIAVHQDLIYAIGGVSSEGVSAKVEVYDPQADAWSTGAPKPTSVGFASAVEVGGKIYVPGGFDAGRQPRDTLEVYDPVTDSWEAGASLPQPLGAYGLAAMDGKIYLFGGRGETGYVDSALRYDPEADAWEELPPLEQARGFLGATTLDGSIYVVGGFDDVAEFDNCDLYDPVSETWSPCASMQAARGGFALVAVRNHMYAIGGGMDSYLAFNERYDPRIDAWSPVETPVSGEWRGLGAGFVYPNLYAIGGWNGDFLSTNEAFQAFYQIILP
jgi:DNA-binding CsgD family transcriptional regulator/N-acetylneuraminic acid mutarotase